MQKSNQKLTIAVPVSTISDIPHLREKTLQIGLIARAAAIFRVNEIIIYSDNPSPPNQKKDRKLFVTILSYIETPQYLRKRLFKIIPELKYAGILPPLRTPHHPIQKRAKNLKKGEYREGAIIATNQKGSLVDIGVENPILLPNKEFPLNKRVTVKITNLEKPIKAILANLKNIKKYWGYTAIPSKSSIGKIIKSSNYDLVIATSKSGTPIEKTKEKLSQKWKNAKKILIAFGAPTKGLKELVKKENLGLEQLADFIINTIPDQGTETVRTEEALYASLAILNNF